MLVHMNLALEVDRDFVLRCQKQTEIHNPVRAVEVVVERHVQAWVKPAPTPAPAPSPEPPSTPTIG